MEFDDDPRLKRLLGEWRVPDAPGGLESRVIAQARTAGGVRHWGRRLLRSRVQVPLPVALAFSVALMWLVFLASQGRSSTAEPVDLRGFQPVNSVNVRVERTSDDTK